MPNNTVNNVIESTAYAVLCGGATSTSAVQSIASVGTSGQVLTSNGAGALPTFQANGSGDVTAASNLTDLAVVRGDGGAKGVKTSTMLISNNGEMTNPSQPAFGAYLSSTAADVTGDGTAYTVVFDTEAFDQNADYNNGTGIFTAPVTGKYLFTLSISVYDLAAGHTGGLVSIVTTGRTYYANSINVGAVRDASSYYGFVFSCIADMSATNTAYATVTVSGSTKVVNVSGGAGGFTYFSGALLC